MPGIHHKTKQRALPKWHLNSRGKGGWREEAIGKYCVYVISAVEDEESRGRRTQEHQTETWNRGDIVDLTEKVTFKQRLEGSEVLDKHLLIK